MKKRFNGKWSPKMLAECSWSLKRETPTGEYTDKAVLCVEAFVGGMRFALLKKGNCIAVTMD
jgi:hypothetical protein